ncbi:MAG: TolC family protein [Acidobacteriia bacterium]|nr:TolC family protein [Terriglobia bacterium]
MPRAFTQTTSPQASNSAVEVFTLERAIQYAREHYPAVRASVERIQAAQGGVSLALTNYLPSVNTLWQSNRATANNIVGLLLPQGVISSISGPVLPHTSDRGVWGSAAGVLWSWEPFDFGYRRATVNVARAGENIARSQSDLTQLDVATGAAQAFFSLLAAEQVVRTAQANVNRWEVFDKSVHVLVDNQLRPGADASRADAELALARTQLIQAQTAERIRRAAFADILGMTGTNVEVDPGHLLTSVPEENIRAVPLASHPAAAAQNSLVEQVKAQERALDRSFVPHFFTEAALSGRGSGANPDGTDATGLNGLGLERMNYAVGITVTFPLFDYFSTRAQKRIAAANQRAEEARYDQTLQGLSDQVEQAQASLDGARQVARNTPIELQAAQASETQAQARYQAGLATMVEVSEAEGLLVQAEIDDALARLNVWRGLEGMAAAQGNLQPFVQLLSSRRP